MKNNKKFLFMVLMMYLAILVIFLLVISSAAMQAIERYVSYMRSDTLIIIFFTLIFLITLLMVMILGVYSKIEKAKKEKDETNINISLGDERSYLEKQINELNKKLVSTDERWNEMYHLVLASQSMQNEKTGVVSVSKFLSGFGIDFTKIKIQNDMVFVLTPFHDDFMHTYKIIKSSCEKIKLTAMRGDEEFVHKDILQHIIKCMVKSRVVIANLNGRNPNVFYELGIAHTLNKPTILLAHRDTLVPFDLQNQYLVLYKDDEELCKRLTESLLMIMTLDE